MRQATVPSFSTPTIGRKSYKRFRGVDYSTDETQINDGRSPRAVNVIADEGGAPERRWGWRTVVNLGSDKPIAGIFPYEATTETGRTMIIHAGDTLYKVRLNESTYLPIPDSQQTLLTGLRSGGRSQGFYLNGKLYILTGSEYLVYDGKDAKHVGDDTAYCPLTSYQRKPSGGGEAYEKVNMICKWRRNRFVGDGSSKTFQLDVTGIDKEQTITAKYHITGDTLEVASFDAKKGTVTLKTAPKAPENAGTSNIEIRFAKTTEDRKKILGCTIFAIYGMDGSGDRVFFSGNGKYANTEWFSGLTDPTYFPDINYSVVGSSDFPIMCYLKAQGELLIIKKDNRQEGTIWHHAGVVSNDVAAFPLKEGVPGYGAVARYSAGKPQRRSVISESTRRVCPDNDLLQQHAGAAVILPVETCQSEAHQGKRPCGCGGRHLARVVCSCRGWPRVCGGRQSGQAGSGLRVVLLDQYSGAGAARRPADHVFRHRRRQGLQVQ